MLTRLNPMKSFFPSSQCSHILSKCLDKLAPLLGGCSKGLKAFRFFFKQVAAWLHDGGACTKFSLSVKNGLANAGTEWPNPSRETKFSSAKNTVFHVQLTIRRIDNYPSDPYSAGSVDDTWHVRMLFCC